MAISFEDFTDPSRLVLLAGPCVIESEEHVNRMADAVAPHWPRPKDERALAYRVEIDGRPRMRCELSFEQAAEAGEDQGLIATAMRAINAIAAVQAAPAGLLSALEVAIPEPLESPIALLERRQPSGRRRAGGSRGRTPAHAEEPWSWGDEPERTA